MECFKNETPFTKNFEEFKTYYEEKWRKQWSEQAVEIIRDAYCVDISEMRVEQNLYQNDFISIYKDIIVKCRFLKQKASQQQDKVWAEQLENMKQRYQVELLKELTSTIQYFCVEN